MAKWGIGIIEIKVGIFKIDMIRDTGETIEFWNPGEISFSVVLPNGFNIPGNKGFIYLA
jgi:hypothetical protein